MSRYLHTLRLFWHASLAAEMEYRVHFMIAALTSITGLTGSLFTLSLLYRTGYAPGGWPWLNALLLMGIFTLIDGFSAACLAPNLSRIVQHVQSGTLDFVLLKPIDSQFWLSTRNLSPWGLPNIALGVGLVIYSGVRLNLAPVNYLWGLAATSLGLVIIYSLWFVMGATSVWFVKIYNLTEVLRNLMEAGRYPVSAYPVLPRLIFTFVIPVAFLTTVPAQAVLGQATPRWLLGAAGIAIVLFAISRLFWRFALRYYTSASS